MDNKKKMRNLLIYLGIPILIILAVAMLLNSNKTASPKTSDLEQYFIEDKVDSYTINYGTGVIEITLKEGETAIVPTSPTKSSQAATSQSVQETTSPASSGMISGAGKRVVVKGQLADIQRFLNNIQPYQASADEAVEYDLIRASDNSLLMEMIPTIIIMVVLIGAWVFIMKKMGGGGLGGKEMSFGKAKIKNTNDEKRKTTFDDVAGADEEKEELAEVVEFLKAPDKYNKLGARIPRSEERRVGKECG